jgi:hypothetical protein
MPNGGYEPLDLGTLQLKLKRRKPGSHCYAVGPHPGWEAFSLESFRGKYVLLNLDGWSKASGEQMAELKKLSTDLQGNPRLAFVGINIWNCAKGSARSNPKVTAGNRRCSAGGHGRNNRKFGVDSLRGVFSAQGQIIARDLKGERLQQTVKTALNQIKSKKFMKFGSFILLAGVLELRGSPS